MAVATRPGAMALAVMPSGRIKLGQGMGEIDQPGLGGGVMHLAHAAPLPADGGDVDDAAPFALASMAGKVSCATMKAPRRLTASIRSQSASVMVSNGFSCTRAALLTTMSMPRPKCFARSRDGAA